jgi:hypothetical protein
MRAASIRDDAESTFFLQSEGLPIAFLAGPDSGLSVWIAGRREG